MPTEKMTKRELMVGCDQSAPLRVKLMFCGPTLELGAWALSAERSQDTTRPLKPLRTTYMLHITRHIVEYNITRYYRFSRVVL